MRVFYTHNGGNYVTLTFISNSSHCADVCCEKLCPAGFGKNACVT